MAAPGTVTIGTRLFRQSLAGERELDDRNSGSVVVEDQRRQSPRRHLPQQGLRNGGDLRIGGADIGTGLEENFDDADAGIIIGLDAFDVIDGRRQCSLKLAGHAAGHLFRRQAGVLPDCRNYRNADFRKNVDRRPRRRERADDEEQEREDDERIGAPQCDADNGRHLGTNSQPASKAGPCGPP
jgi:hypothetical protein